MFADLLSNVVLGLSTALSPSNFLFCLVGVTLGTFLGVIPGVGTLATMSMLFPITFYLDPATAMIMMAGIWYGSTYGGSTASVLLNLPGTPANVIACLDGYPMAQQGRAGVALLMTTVASFFGASVGIILMMLFSLPLVGVALSFGSAEYFSLMMLGLVAACVMSEGGALKGISMVILGVLVGMVGMDTGTGAMRFTFGMIGLWDGISLVALAMGLFGVAEVIASIRTVNMGGFKKDFTLRSMLPSADETRASLLPMIRGSGFGSFIGIMPGVGPAVAAFMSYAAEKKIARVPSRFGHGAIEGLTGPEAANSAADVTSFIPTMALGIPGGATMALLLGMLMIHGISPGPTMIAQRPDLFWGLVMSFWVGNILLLVLNIPLIGVWIRVLMIPYKILYPSILVFICIGVYTINNNTFDVIIVFAFGALGYFMRVLNFPLAPLLLGFVLGPMMEEHLRRALNFSHGSFKIFLESPISLGFIIATVALLAWGVWSSYGSVRRRRAF